MGRRIGGTPGAIPDTSVFARLTKAPVAAAFECLAAEEAAPDSSLYLNPHTTILRS
jgi:hypothetical protein